VQLFETSADIRICSDGTKEPIPNSSAKRSCTQGFTYIIQPIVVDLKAKAYSVLCWYIMHNICPNVTFRLNWKVEDTARKPQNIYMGNALIM
jgi:hypothetical protein